MSSRVGATSIFNAIARLWNRGPGAIGFSIPEWVPGIGGNRFSVPDIPILHNGGIVPGNPGTETLIIAEAGEQVTTLIRETLSGTIDDLDSITERLRNTASPRVDLKSLAGDDNTVDTDRLLRLIELLL